MAEHLEPVRIPVPGGKIIEELAGRVSTGHNNYSVARMSAPAGWEEPAQTPVFDEVTYVVSGEILVHTGEGTETIRAGAALLTRAGERVRYEAGPDGADYLAVCVPAFSEEGAHRA
ncbi:cupin domain-containing protein [Ornithinimicrobium murale]|uniref:cupin domain-containing protein n=1 Tax=Ornithinimicrobium murale TaxID=1050153 RepID=UPI000E0DAE5E|nr:cupin [Ornithinimicrobium murale]